MDKDKSILEKITGTMKDIVNIAADAADPEGGEVRARGSAHLPSPAPSCVEPCRETTRAAHSPCE